MSKQLYKTDSALGILLDMAHCYILDLRTQKEDIKQDAFDRTDQGDKLLYTKNELNLLKQLDQKISDVQLLTKNFEVFLKGK